MKLIIHNSQTTYMPCKCNCRYTNSVTHGDPYSKNEKSRPETKEKGKQFSTSPIKKVSSSIAAYCSCCRMFNVYWVPMRECKFVCCWNTIHVYSFKNWHFKLLLSKSCNFAVFPLLASSLPLLTLLVSTQSGQDTGSVLQHETNRVCLCWV